MPFVLSFDVLDDVMEMPQDSRAQELAGASIGSIGPLTEFAYQEYSQATRSLEALTPSVEIRELSRVLNLVEFQQSKGDSSIAAYDVEFFRSPQTEDQFANRNWDTFRRRMQDAAKKAGLGLKFAQGLVATLDEMTSNAVEHSQNPRTSIVGYKWSIGSFEYVVADSGIGLFKSLRSNKEYESISDSSVALDLATQSGVSRHGKMSGRGLGFNELTLNIANRNSQLRFRSGDHSLTFDGTCQPTTKVFQTCSNFEGFLISVQCLSPT